MVETDIASGEFDALVAPDALELEEPVARRRRWPRRGAIAGLGIAASALVLIAQAEHRPTPQHPAADRREAVVAPPTVGAPSRSRPAAKARDLHQRSTHRHRRSEAHRPRRRPVTRRSEPRRVTPVTTPPSAAATPAPPAPTPQPTRRRSRPAASGFTEEFF